MGKSRDKDEVRLENPVPQVLRRYGVPMKGNRFKPFCHKADNYSGKFDNTSCYCYVCNKSFDCFSIVGHFEGIDSLNDQVRFLGGEELPDDDPKRIALKKKADELKAQAAKEAEEKRQRDEEIMRCTKRMRYLRKVLKVLSPGKDEFPCQFWVDAYNELQTLDYHVSALFGTEGGDISYCYELGLNNGVKIAG